MRIIAGMAGSTPLAVPDAGTRPTSDRVRESVFGSLESAGAIEDAAVLDLFAGSGALGLEALSRGAASADLVEKHPRASVVTRRNADLIARAVRPSVVRVHQTSADAFLRRPAGPFDLVFLDPPYDLGATELAVTLGLLVPRLAQHASVVIERATRSGAPVLPAGLTGVRSKAYGDTTVWWAEAD